MFFFCISHTELEFVLKQQRQHKLFIKKQLSEFVVLIHENSMSHVVSYKPY